MSQTECHSPKQQRTFARGDTLSPFSDRPYVFHAFEVSYFSAKVRPALRYKRL